MRIDRLDLLSYGHLRNQTLDLSRPASGLTVVVGPNEAGKSTTLRAIRALLFGIERGSTDDHRMGRESLRVGAALRDDGGALGAAGLATGAGGAVYEVVRQGLSKAPLVTPDGERVDELLLARLLGDVERALFATLFCVDHDELHDRSEELLDPDAEIGRLVFGASLGAAPLARVLKDLDARADALYRPRGSVQLVAKSLTQARELTRQMRQARVRAGDWEQADTELKRLEREAVRLAADVARMRTQVGFVERLTAAVPPLARRAVALESMSELELRGAVQTGQWAQAVGQVRQDLAAVELEHQRAVVTRDELLGQLAAMPATSPLLVAAERIDLLLQGIGRFRKDRDDLPARQSELALSRRTLGDLLERLGMEETAVRSVTDARIAAVDDLAQARTALAAELTSARRELDALVQALAEAHRDLGELPEAPDAEQLARVAAVATTYVERERQAGRERGELRALAGDVEVRAAQLGLETADAHALETLPAPALTAVRAHRQATADLETRRAGIVQALDQAGRQAQALRDEADGIKADASVPDPGAVGEARGRRDQGWRLVRATWLAGDADADAVERWAAGRPLADAYESAVAGADGADDRRFQHASQLATLQRLAAELLELEEEGQSLAARLAATGEEEARLAAAWAELWAPVGVCPDGTDAGEEWLAGLADLQRTAADHRRRAAVLAELDTEVASQVAALSGALRQLGEEPSGGTLELLVKQADEVVAAARAAADARAAVQRQIAQGERERPHREEAVRVAEGALATWESEWSAALSSLGMTQSAGVAAGRETLKLLREYRGEQREADSLRGRVEGIGADIAAYSARVAALVQEVAPELAGLDPDRVLSELKPRLDDARREGRLREDVEGRLEQAARQVDAAGQALRDARDSLAGLRRQAGLGEDADLAAEAERALEHAGLAATVRDIEAGLVEQTGMVVTDLLREVGDVREAEAELAARLAGVRAELDDTDTRRQEVDRKVGEARTQLGLLDHAGEAARLEQDAELEFAALATHVSDYARIALAAEVLRRVVNEYGRRNQGPIIEFASRNFTALTDGAFDALLTDLDGDKQVLLARRVNGEHLRIAELSEGTVDQLYLALRLAGIEHHLSQAGASPPVVLDDILVNFDDGRAAAALRLFADLGAQAQVLLFTHHRHVGDLAQRVLEPARVHVAELAARDHAAAFAAPEKPAPRAVRGGVAAGAGGEAAQQAILGVLRDASVPLGKAEILERTGIGDAEWGAAIRTLVERGAVVQEGVKRGARYSVGG